MMAAHERGWMRIRRRRCRRCVTLPGRAEKFRFSAAPQAQPVPARQTPTSLRPNQITEPIHHLSKLVVRRKNPPFVADQPPMRGVYHIVALISIHMHQLRTRDRMKGMLLS
jgi:hypothetical protein